MPILLVDDDQDFCKDVAAMLAPDCSVFAVHTPVTASEVIQRHEHDLVLLDLDLRCDVDGFDLLREIRASADPPEVIVLTGESDVEAVVRAMKMGAFHYVMKYPSAGALRNLVSRALESVVLRRRIRFLEELASESEFGLSAESERTKAVLRQVERVASTNARVLLTGETGTGKTILARHIHMLGPRAPLPFERVNCAAVAAGLIESEIFGHEKGAFTGAVSSRRGALERAGGGTLFLDEIGDTTPEFQSKILHVLDEGSYERVGGDRAKVCTARIIAGTNRDLERCVSEGTFREDLYHRLNVFRIHVPPLRERREDILPLAAQFLRTFSREQGKQISGFSPAARDYLVNAKWEGNVRDLKNAIERAVIQCDGEVIDVPDFLSLDVSQDSGQEGYMKARDRALRQFKATYVSQKLREADGNATGAARLAGVTRTAFQRLMREVGIAPTKARS